MSIKCLYINGCSWTYGEELGHQADPNEQSYKFYNSWPWHVSQHYNIPQLINDARGGGSNDRIFRKTVEFIKNTKVKYSELAIVVAWTSSERTEFGFPALEGYHDGESQVNWSERQFYNFHPGSDPIDFALNNAVVQKTLSELYKNYTILRTPQTDQPRQAMLMYSLQEICKANGIKLHQFLALHSPELNPNCPDYDRALAKNLNYHMPAWIDTNDYGDIINKLHEREDGKWIHKAKYNHPNESGHKIIADFVIERIGETI